MPLLPLLMNTSPRVTADHAEGNENERREENGEHSDNTHRPPLAAR